MVLHIVFACGDPGARRAAVIPRVPCPVTTIRARFQTVSYAYSKQGAATRDSPERGVEDRRVVAEELRRVAVRRGPMRHGRAPAVGLRRAGAEVGRDRVAGEEPDGDAAVDPLHCGACP